MIIPSIDLMDGRAVQLRRGRELVLEGGDPLERLEEFSVAGEVAVVDLDAALGKGSNAEVIREMVRRAPCRVGGGIRDLETAVDWLDAGATRVVIGTAASVDFCSQLPRERVVAAVDSDEGTVVVEGWRTATSHHVIDRMRELAPAVGGFLLTQVEHEGGMSGFSMELVERAVEAAGDARVTAAGGITTAEDVAALDRLGVDSQVGMALYSGHLTLGSAVAAPLAKGVEDRLWPTVVCEDYGAVLGLVWSTRESLEAAVSQSKGIYWSRSRGELWIKGETSGATQDLLRVDLDCDRDALRFTVRQRGSGFCHTGERACWPSSFTLSSLARVIEARRDEAVADSERKPSTTQDRLALAGSSSESGDQPESSGSSESDIRTGSVAADSGTARVLANPALMRAKLLEEAAELSEAADRGSAIHEAADLIYFALVAASRHGATLDDIQRELAGRHLRVRRRPMTAKTGGGTE